MASDVKGPEMMSSPIEFADALSLIVITDPEATIGTVPAVQAAVAAGARAVQLRWKSGTAGDMVHLAKELREITRSAGALLFINDRVDVALAVDADGVHLGDDDLPVSTVRRTVPQGFLIGKSVDTPEEAAQAALEGADYVGAGPVYATSSKGDTGPVLGLDGLARFRDGELPVVAIGGITAGRAEDVIRTGASGVAVIGAVMFTTDPGEATRELLEAIEAGRTAPPGPR
jgi:thiamine-phosphate pyrophosphorylase